MKLDLLDVEREFLNGCAEAIESEHDFTEEEQLYYNVFSAIQALRVWKEGKK